MDEKVMRIVSYLGRIYSVLVLSFAAIGIVSVYLYTDSLISILVGAVAGWTFVTLIVVSLVFVGALLFLGYAAVRFLLESMR